jgi:hypothetical protein
MCRGSVCDVQVVRDVHDAEVFHFGIWLALDIAPSFDLSKASRTRVQSRLGNLKIRGNLKRNSSADRNETPVRPP